MTEPGLLGPPGDSWVASVHAGTKDLNPLGSAVVVDSRRVLTCAHVVMVRGECRELLWVCFPKSDVPDDEWRQVVSVDWVYEPPVTDLAVLELNQDVPDGIEAAPLRCPRPGDIVGKRWWAFGFPDGDPIGDSADGFVGAALARGWVRLDTESRYLVRPGFSGAGLWSSAYGAVVGIVGQAHDNGDGRAITLYRADQSLPGQKLRLLTAWSVRAAGDVALAAWGWSLASDPEGVRHWRPRARGVSVESERGHRFRGRLRALTEITGWLDRPVPDRRALVVTGSPGVGKSAVLGRIVTTADAAIAVALPADDVVRARVGSVACAVHAKSKTALEVAAEIARAASARLPAEPSDIAPVIREVLEEGVARPRFNVVIDALDEAASPVQARVIVNSVVLPLVETCSDVGVQVVVGTRRHDNGGSLLEYFEGGKSIIDLDHPEYFAEEDLAQYALACLQLVGDERAENPYSDHVVALAVARRIAELSDRNFLVAGLVARGHGMHDELAVDPAELAFDATVGAALARYLERVGSVSGLSASHVLTGLAFAEAPGLPLRLWQLVLESLYGTRVSPADLSTFARSAAANFLVESSQDHYADPVFRLFHQALNDALAAARTQFAAKASDERAIAGSLTAEGKQSKWENVSAYLLRSLPNHAAAAGRIDDLLTDDDYLLHADLRRLLLAAGHPTSEPAQRGVQLLGLTLAAASADSRERAAMFSVTQALENMPPSYLDSRSAPYLARWAHAQPQGARAVLAGHRSPVNGVCVVEVAGRQLLASVSRDATVRVWDPGSGELRAVLQGHEDEVFGVCAVEVAGRQLLASVSRDATVRTWDPVLGEMLAVLRGHDGAGLGVCAVQVAGRQLLASVGADGTVRTWDPASGQQRTVLRGHRGGVRGVCAVEVAGRQLLASVGADGTVRTWDPASGQLQLVMEGHTGLVYGVCALKVAGTQLLASSGGDGTVRTWDPVSGEERAVLQGHRESVYGICAVEVMGQQLLASAGIDQTVRVWDTASGEQRAVLQGHADTVTGVCAVDVAGRQLLASASSDATVRLWDPGSRELRAVPQGHRGWVPGVCAIEMAGVQLLASAGADGTVRLWEPGSGEARAMFQYPGNLRDICAVTVSGRQLLASAGHDGILWVWDPASAKPRSVQLGGGPPGPGPVYGVCAVEVAGRQLLASAGHDKTVRVWDPMSGKQRAVLQGHQRLVLDVCAVEVDDRQLLASASGDGMVRVWDPASGELRAVLQGHQDWVRAVCAVQVAGRQLLASASDDKTVRVWDPASGEQLVFLQGHDEAVFAVCAVEVAGRQLLASADNDGVVRVWDPHTAACTLTLSVHHPARAIAWVGGGLAIGLRTGILMIDLRITG